jgi:hypothetical protein
MNDLTTQSIRYVFSPANKIVYLILGVVLSTEDICKSSLFASNIDACSLNRVV